MNSMAAMFYILSFLLYTKGRQTESSTKTCLLFTGCTLAGILAIGCKEIAVTLPFFIFLYEWYFFQDLRKAWIRRHFMYPIGAIVLVVLLAYAYMGPNPVKNILSDYAIRDFTLTQRILTQSRVIVYYISLLLFPHPSRLNLLHEFTISRSLVDPITTLLSIMALVGLIGLAFCQARKEPLISFCIFSFLGNLVIESSFIGLEIIFEHRTYLPSMFFFLIIVCLAYKYINKSLLRTLIFGVVVLVLSLWTYERNSVWKDPVTFWNDAITKSPHNARAYNNLGKLYVDKRNYSLAIMNLKQAIHLDPRMIQAYNNLGNAYVHQGLYDLAVKTYLKALDIEPGYHVTYKNLGVALREQGNISAALEAHTKAVEMKPTDDEGYNFLGLDYLAQDRIDLAIELFRKALTVNPYSHMSYHHLGLAYRRKGDLQKATSMYRRAIAIRPDFGLAYTNLGILYLNHYSADKAIPVLRTATEVDPMLADAHSSLGLALFKKGLFEQGIVELKKALQLQPNHKNTIYNLGRGYEVLGRYEAAIAQYDKCIDLDPEDIEAYHNAGVLCLYSLGDKKRAMRYFKKALAIDPQHPKSQEVKDALKDLGLSP
jgi:tetratricopeptide (TPR) repeat protein